VDNLRISSTPAHRPHIGPTSIKHALAVAVSTEIV